MLRSSTMRSGRGLVVSRRCSSAATPSDTWTSERSSAPSSRASSTSIASPGSSSTSRMRYGCAGAMAAIATPVMVGSHQELKRSWKPRQVIPSGTVDIDCIQGHPAHDPGSLASPRAAIASGIESLDAGPCRGTVHLLSPGNHLCIVTLGGRLAGFPLKRGSEWTVAISRTYGTTGTPAARDRSRAGGAMSGPTPASVAAPSRLSDLPVPGSDALDILLIEDDLGDALLVQEFLDE